ncbi:hypothetical protein LTR36_002166 [Oleoguttula mirabilis]|uniref:Uncharacterized protein n=1 Tax=Oleoguttula mirabilis TaxID=1507867 RepID=A0AAV9JL71_9PEZI|nr:hypothetical protein LTR36_002166 [Oleoguttula mirabilis]
MTIRKLAYPLGQHEAVVHTTGSGKTLVGTYRNEYALVVAFTEEKSKVVRVEEFADATFSDEIFAQVQVVQTRSKRASSRLIYDSDR